ncbi:uncharacterized protein I303_103554 [Kwoniella dejecticola CBS 10117]|uniref:Major facilitator superfamily (MFS) profile domain-containing protein n=1 Tax=Kwoniella dejecticola CBS 10117 TaxID=1296121 RepID=A0A1A6A727_9TREE|nr:uncharacterized protein I303_03576 [Kwoniella dejecticola CBS 10117]OBR85862.1 hypothetical protein I303_03576 [Kwoniella dejecticola CBS 10117]
MSMSISNNSIDEKEDLPTALPASTSTVQPVPRAKARSNSHSRHQQQQRQQRPHLEVDPFPIQLHISRSRSHSHSHTHHLHRPPTRNDGYDNFPPPLQGIRTSADLERRLTTDADLAGQMAVSDGEIGPPPEGGKDAWLCVASAFFVLFCVFGFVTVFGQLKVYYLANQLKDYSQSDVAWIASLQTFITFAGSIVAGRWFDSHGARGLVMVGTSLSVAAVIGIAFCKLYYQFLLAHALFGISASMLYSPSTAVAGHWFMKRRSTAVGIVVCGSGLSGVIYPIALKRLFDELHFRNAMLIIAGLNAFLMFPAWFFLKARLPPRSPPPLKSLTGPWKEPRYTCLVLGSCLVMMNWLSPYFDAPNLITSNNVTGPIADYSIAILQVGSFFGRASSGVLADKFGVWLVFILSILGCAISILAFWVASPIGSGAVVVGLVGYGFASGAWVTLVAASTATISPIREFGMRLGMLWSVTSVPSLIGPVICGVLISASGGTFKYAGLFVGLTQFLGAFITIAPRLLDYVRDFQDRRNEESNGKLTRKQKQEQEAAA